MNTHFPRRLWAVARKEWMHIGRDLATLYFALGMPVLLLILFGYAVSFDVDRIRTYVVDDDRTAHSRELTSHLFAGETFIDQGRLERSDEAEAVLRRREADAVILVPRGYGASVARGEEARVQVLVDAADNVTAGSVLADVAGFVVYRNQGYVDETLGPTAELIEGRVRALFNPRLRSVFFLVPGLIALIQSIMGVLLTALTVAREWERGTMEQLFATPVGRFEIVLGKLLPYFAVAMAQLLLVVTVAAWVFDVPLRGSFWLLLGVSSLFLASTLGQGLLISSVTKNQMLATQVAAVSSMLPAMMLSGLIIPIDNMPVVIQWFTNAIPARHFVDALRGLFLRGVPLSALYYDLAALGAFAAVVILAGAARFRRVIA